MALAPRAARGAAEMPKKGGDKKDAKNEEAKEGDAGDSGAATDARIVGPGELDDNGLPRPQDVLELVTKRMQLEKSMEIREKLDDENRRLREELQRQSGEQTEIFAYLNKELSSKASVIASLEGKVSELETTVKEGRREFDQRLLGEKLDARETATNLAREVGRYEQELGDLNLFISRKTELEGELQEVKNELLKERQKHENIIEELEDKTKLEKDRLRKEMETRIREAKEAFMQMTDGQLEDGTKETMQQNEQMASELAFQHRETERLIAKNRALSEENLSTRRELAVFKHAEAELSKRNHAYLMTIQSLITKLRALEDASASINNVLTTSDETVTSSYKNKVQSLQASVEETLQLLDGMRGQLEKKTTEVQQIKMEREELGFLVLQAAHEAKGHLTDSFYGQEDLREGARDDAAMHGGPGPAFTQQIQLQGLTVAQRHQVLRYIVERVSDLHAEARKNIAPVDKGGGKSELFPRIGKPGAAKSLTGRSSIDTQRQRVRGGGDYTSEGGRQ